MKVDSGVLKVLGKKLRALKPSTHRVFVGLDGFVDNIIHVVDKRLDAEHFDRFETITDFSKRVAAAAGKSANFELAVHTQKLGGNGPIMANALSRAGYRVSYMGVLGAPDIHPVFAEFAARCDKVYSLAAPGETDAYEFADGKLMMGKYASLNKLSWKMVLDKVGKKTLIDELGSCDLMGMVNWTMLLGMTGVWRGLQKDVLPNIKKRLTLFIDLTDPAKRTIKDLGEAMKVLQGFSKTCDVVLGLNLREAEQVAALLKMEGLEGQPLELAKKIHQQLKISRVVVHPVSGAACSGPDGSFEVTGPYTPKPKITTGAGDNFNAGFCNGLLAGADSHEALYAGVCTSGYYVRNMKSPDRAGLTKFVEFWSANPEKEGAAFDKAYASQVKS